MIGKVAEIGVPLWPWHVLHTCAFAATPSSALAGNVAAKMPVAVDRHAAAKTIAKWRLGIPQLPMHIRGPGGETATARRRALGPGRLPSARRLRKPISARQGSAGRRAPPRH